MSEESQSAGSDFPKDQPRRYHPFVLGIVAVSLALYILNAWRPWEPRVHGKPLSVWIEQYRHGRHPEAQTALRYLYSLGDPQANGAIELLNTPDVAWEKKLTEFRKKLSRDKNFHVVSRRAQRHRGLELLRAMGLSAKPALPHIRPWLSSDDALMRAAAIATVFNIGATDPETQRALVDSGLKTWDTFPLLTLAALYRQQPTMPPDGLKHLTNRLASISSTNGRDTRNLRFIRSTCHILQALGPAAATVPYLKQLRETGHASTRMAAEQALWHIAPGTGVDEKRAEKLAGWLESLQALDHERVLQELKATNVVTAPFERRIAASLQRHVIAGRMHMLTDPLLASLGKEAEQLTPLLRTHLDHRDKDHAISAARALWKITGDIDESLPTLLTHLPTYPGRHAALAIADMGPEAKRAVKPLEDYLNQRGRLPHYAFAHWSVTGRTEEGAPQLRQLLSIRNPNRRVDETLIYVVKMGEDAAALAPELLEIANRPQSSFSERRRAITALKSCAPDKLSEIDPERLEEFKALVEAAR